MNLIEKFHNMESKNKLFELGFDNDLPVWDIIRYKVYVKYYFSEQDRQLHEKPYHHPTKNYFIILVRLLYAPFLILFKKGKIVYFTNSRYRNNNGIYFDKSALPFIKYSSYKCLVVEPFLESKLAYPYIYDISMMLGKILGNLFVSKKTSMQYFQILNNIIISHFGENLISAKEVHVLLNRFKRSYYFYKFIFNLKKTEKVFISKGNPKAEVKAAKELNIKTYLIQHAGIEFDEVDYSYPKGVSHDSNLLFPDYLLTFGTYWCKNINVPVKEIYVCGNDYFYSKPNIEGDNTILIISTIIHGRELSNLTKKLADQNTNLTIIYKLHPNEYQEEKLYKEFFSANKNVNVISNQIDTNILIAKCKLVILIVSAVLYEALNQNKKVAIYKKVNYERQISLSYIPNVYFFDTVQEISKILKNPVEPLVVDFFEPSNYEIIKKLLK